jgi:hypothetical protein
MQVHSPGFNASFTEKWCCSRPTTRFSSRTKPRVLGRLGLFCPRWQTACRRQVRMPQQRHPRRRPPTPRTRNTRRAPESVSWVTPSRAWGSPLSAPIARPRRVQHPRGRVEQEAEAARRDRGRTAQGEREFSGRTKTREHPVCSGVWTSPVPVAACVLASASVMPPTVIGPRCRVDARPAALCLGDLLFARGIRKCLSCSPSRVRTVHLSGIMRTADSPSTVAV